MINRNDIGMCLSSLSACLHQVSATSLSVCHHRSSLLMHFDCMGKLVVALNGEASDGSGCFLIRLSHPCG